MPLRPAAALLLALGVAACAPAPTRAPTPGSPPGPPYGSPPGSAEAPLSFAPLVRRVLPAVVSIAVSETAPQRPGARPARMVGVGSGFIVAPDGVVVTNNHVIAHADRIMVALADGVELPARVLGRDPPTDVAVLQVDPPRPLPAVVWGRSHRVQVGDWVLTAGNPFGLGGSVTAGIVSAKGRSLGDGPFDRFLQLDAPINPGNSGGPTFNMNGHVVGMTTAIVSPSGGSVGLGFAIPSDVVRPVVVALLAHGLVERGWLGVALAAGPGGARHPRGAGVTAVERDSPAARAGLRPGDRVMAVDGRAVQDGAALVRAVAALAPGTVAHLTLRRGAATLTLPVTLGRRPADAPD